MEVFLLFVQLCLTTADPDIKRGRFGITLFGLTQPLFVSVPSQGLDLHHFYVLVSLSQTQRTVSIVVG